MTRALPPALPLVFLKSGIGRARWPTCWAKWPWHLSRPFGSREPGSGKWQTEGGGRLQGVMGLGSPAAEALACFFDEVRKRFFLVDAATGLARSTRLDDELGHLGIACCAGG